MRSASINPKANTPDLIGDRSHRTVFFLIISVLIIFPRLNAFAQKSYEWPSFHGADRTNKSPETGLLREWPDNGTDLQWTISGLGEGYSSVTTGGSYIYTAGLNNN